MIKLGRLTDYAVVVLAEMAGSQGALLAASSLSARTGLPEPTVAKILKLLARSGLIDSVRGASGGYVLNRSPDDIPVTEVITAMEGPIALTACADGNHESCSLSSLCGVHGRWGAVNVAINAALQSVTLAQMVRPLWGQP